MYTLSSGELLYHGSNRLKFLQEIVESIQPLWEEYRREQRPTIAFEANFSDYRDFMTDKGVEEKPCTDEVVLARILEWMKFTEEWFDIPSSVTNAPSSFTKWLTGLGDTIPVPLFFTAMKLPVQFFSNSREVSQGYGPLYTYQTTREVKLLNFDKPEEWLQRIKNKPAYQDDVLQLLFPSISRKQLEHDLVAEWIGPSSFDVDCELRAIDDISIPGRLRDDDETLLIQEEAVERCYPEWIATHPVMLHQKFLRIVLGLRSVDKLLRELYSHRYKWNPWEYIVYEDHFAKSVLTPYAISSMIFYYSHRWSHYHADALLVLSVLEEGEIGWYCSTPAPEYCLIRPESCVRPV